MNDFGPRLPPHLVKKRKPVSEESEDSDDLIGPVPVNQVDKIIKQRSIEFTSDRSQQESVKGKILTLDKAANDTEKIRAPSLYDEHLKKPKTDSSRDKFNYERDIKAKVLTADQRSKMIKEAKSLDDKFTREFL